MVVFLMLNLQIYESEVMASVKNTNFLCKSWQEHINFSVYFSFLTKQKHLSDTRTVTRNMTPFSFILWICLNLFEALSFLNLSIWTIGSYTRQQYFWFLTKLWRQVWSVGTGPRTQYLWGAAETKLHSKLFIFID